MLAVIYLLIALFAIVLAVPTSSSHRSFTGNTISLSKRASLVDEDGVVKPGALKAQLARVSTKLSRGFSNYQKNTGLLHPLDKGVKIEKRSKGSTNLTDFSGGVLWHGQIAVGTPPENFSVDFDTGSSDLFLPSVACSDNNCNGHKLWSPNASSTANDERRQFSLRFGDGSTVAGELYSDTVSFAGGNITATNQRIGAANIYSEGFAQPSFPADGLLGMAFPQISAFPAEPVFQTLIRQNQTDEAVFAFKLNANDSNLFLGGVDSSKFTGELTRVNLTQLGFWQIPMDSVIVNGESALGNISTIVDTGTTLILGDIASVVEFYGAIPGSADASETVGSGFYTFPCDGIPDVSLTFGGKAFPISAETLNLGKASLNSSDCVGGVGAFEISNVWIIGDVFLQNVYSVFDVGNEQVGFATLST